MNNKIKSQLNFIEVCSGAGGLSLGFILEGFKPIFLNEIDKTFCKTLELNHPNVKIIEKSMEEINMDDYKDEEIDILMGGVNVNLFLRQV